MIGNGQESDRPTGQQQLDTCAAGDDWPGVVLADTTGSYGTLTAKTKPSEVVVSSICLDSAMEEAQRGLL